MLLGIVTASASEASAFLHRETQPGRVYSVGDKGLLVVAGNGEDRVQAAAGSLLQKGAGALLGLGVAVGLRADLTAGDVILPKKLIVDSTGYPVSSAWHKAVQSSLGSAMPVCDAPLGHSHQTVFSPEYKQQLCQDGSLAAADSESAGVARAAQAAGVPWLLLRVIGEPLELVMPAMWADHRLQRLSLNAAVLSRPWLWSTRATINRCADAARAKLGQLAAMLESGLLPPAGVAG